MNEPDFGEVVIQKNGGVRIYGLAAEMIADLMYGLEEEIKTGTFPYEMEDWECRLADHLSAQIRDGMERDRTAEE